MAEIDDQVGFNTQPPEGGWAVDTFGFRTVVVSTHSRPKAAGFWDYCVNNPRAVSTHSRPKAAGIFYLLPQI